MQPQSPHKEAIKQAIIAICIGAVINLVTIVAQATVHWLQHVQPEIPGTLVGLAKYIHSIKSQYNV